jgi:hypothetical protein
MQGIEACGFKAFGGQDSPYVYVDLEGRKSWDVFSEILEKAQVRVEKCLLVTGTLIVLLKQQDQVSED